jgi:hypothetical protein
MVKNFIPDIRVGVASNGLSLRDIRDMAKQNPALFMERVNRLVNDKKLSLAKMRDLRGLYAVLSDIQVPIQIDVMGMGMRSVMASAFPILTGTLAIAMINDAYAAVPTIGERLVTDFDDAKKVTSIAAVSALDKDIDEVKEGQDFPEISATEEKAEIRHKRNGRLLRITAEAIEENELPDIVAKINALGEIAADWVEEQTLKRVCDYDGSAASPAEPYVYRPDGSGASLFSATANTPGTRAPSGTCVQNNALVDETDIETARVRTTTMKNNRGKRISIPWSVMKILLPDALLNKALKIFHSELVPGVENERSSYGPGARWNMSDDRILSSPKIDDLSTTAWYMGWPEKQFKRKWKLRFEYVTLGSDTESYLKSRVAFQARIAWDVEVGAVDYVYWVQCLAVSTFPKDD